MPVPSSINDLSTVAGSNPPGGGETPAEGDNHIRAAYSFIAALRDILNGTSSTTVAVQSLAVSGAAAFAGSVSVAGALTANGNVTIGNAAGDALTVNPNAVTWANNPTHSGLHTFSGLVTAAAGVNAGNTSIASPSALDYYLEGTWPISVSSSGGTPTVSGSSYGNYTRIGDRVFFDFYLLVSSFGTSTGAISITGLPFPNGASPDGAAVFMAFTVSDASPVPVGIISSGSTAIALKRTNGANYTPSLTSGLLSISGFGHFRV